jgi:hypothetical protein
MLLGACAERDPQMAGFAELGAYAQERIPDDPLLNHPNAGRPCVERLGARRCRVNFSLRSGAWPELHVCENRDSMVRELVRTIVRQTAPDGELVDPIDILVMVPKREAVGEIAAALRRVGLPVHVPLKNGYDQGASDPRDQPLFRPGTITVSTIHSAKGHTAAICHLAAVELLEEDSEAGGLEFEQKQRATFHVAATRATFHLQLWGRECAVMREARAVLDFLKRNGAEPGCETASDTPASTAAADDARD